MMRRRAVLIVALAFAAAAPASAVDGWQVLDGDTVVTPAGEVVRIANVDTAEMNCRCAYECNMARLAFSFTRRAIVDAGRIELRPYARDKDRYGRSLRHVIVDGQDLGERLVAAHLARPWDGRRRPWCPTP